jgi:hypothetical protein
VKAFLLPAGSTTHLTGDKNADPDKRAILLRSMRPNTRGAEGKARGYGTLQIFVGESWESQLDRSKVMRKRVKNILPDKTIFFEELSRIENISEGLTFDHNFWTRKSGQPLPRLYGPPQKLPYIDGNKS